MPIYEYLCEKCEHEFEREQRITDPPVKTCPRCRSRRVKKLISRTSFVLKGSGWYSDLYASPKQDSKSESGGDAKEASSSDASDGGASKSEPAKGKDEAKGKHEGKDKAKGNGKKAGAGKGSKASGKSAA